MEWVKRRVFRFQKEDPCHTEVDHVVFFRLRSDGTMWYQVSRLSMSDIFHRVPGGWLNHCWERFLNEKTNAPSLSPGQFHLYFELEMRHLRGVELEDF